MQAPSRTKHISFGTTKERTAFPFDVGNHRFGNEMNPITGAPDVGPGKYNNAEKTSMKHMMAKRPMSTRGYVLGARCAPRSHSLNKMITPAPSAYQKISQYDTTSSSYKPFGVSVDRDPSAKKMSITPGPGTYDNTAGGCLQVSYSQSFGGAPTDLPQVKQQSTIARNTDKLPTTKEERRYLRKLAYLKLYY